MKKIAVGVVVGAIVIGGAVFAIGQQGLGATPTSAASTPTVAAVKAPEKVTAEGKVVPARNASLSLQSGGIVNSVLVTEGAKVDSGQVILKLDSARQDVAVAQAEAGLKKAEARRDELKAGPRSQEVQTAQAALEAAQAQLAKVKQSARPEEISSAESALSAAQAAYQKAQQGYDNDLVVAAKNDLAKLKAGPTAEDLKAAELAVEQAKSALWGAQTSRDGVCGSPMAPKFQCDSANAQVSAAEMAVATAQNNLDKVKAGPRTEDIATAQARLDKLMAGTDSATLANAKSQVEQAQAKLDLLKSPARATDVAAAEAEVKRAQSQLDLLMAGNRPETLAGAEADVAAAKAALDEAKVARTQTELRAPYAGTVVSVDTKVGESVAANTPVVQIAELGEWKIETTDLTELNIARVHEGMPAVVTFDGLPGVELPGTVSAVKALGQKQQGDIVYTLTVKPNQHNEQLRWNMTAAVSIDTK